MKPIQISRRVVLNLLPLVWTRMQASAISHPMTWGMSRASTRPASLPCSAGLLEQSLTYNDRPEFPSQSMVHYWDFRNYLCNDPAPSLSMACGAGKGLICSDASQPLTSLRILHAFLQVVKPRKKYSRKRCQQNCEHHSLFRDLWINHQFCVQFGVDATFQRKKKSSNRSVIFFHRLELLSVV